MERSAIRGRQAEFPQWRRFGFGRTSRITLRSIRATSPMEAETFVTAKEYAMALP